MRGLKKNDKEKRDHSFLTHYGFLRPIRTGAGGGAETAVLNERPTAHSSVGREKLLTVVAQFQRAVIFPGLSSSDWTRTRGSLRL